jgi:hypothetical protein
VTAGQPVPCAHCRGPVVATDCGLTHLDARGYLAGWLCPMPHMTLATLPDRTPPQPDPWVQVLQANPPRSTVPPSDWP